MVRKISKSGAVTLPKEVRVTAGLHPGMAVDIYPQGNMICIALKHICCHICGSPENVKKVSSINICRVCAEKIAEVHNGKSSNR